jgi:hypothetical protein
MALTPKAVGTVNSLWIDNLAAELRRGKHVLLHGNVYDRCLYGGSYYVVKDMVRTWLMEAGYDVVCEYDPVDCFRFPDQDVAGKFRELVDGPGGTEPVGESASHAGPSPRADAGAVQLRPPPRISGARPLDPQAAQPAAVFMQLRRALAQPDTSVACIIDLLDMLPDSPDLLIPLRKCMLEAATIGRGKALGYRNALVFLAADLSRVSAWIYTENPLLSLVRATPPEHPERQRFFLDHYRGFEGGTLAESEASHRSLGFADLTDGMTLTDLDAIRRTSRTEGMGIQDESSLRRLVEFYKFGKRDDPWASLDSTKVQDAHRGLSGRVIGQDAAVSAVVDMLVSAQVGITASPSGPAGGRPRGTFFFVGPTGVGKTELAKAITELVFGDESAFARFDMSEYKEEHAAEKLAGAPPGYVGYQAGGQLTNRVIEKPFSVLLFDEIEKAHPKVFDKFLQILEDGRLTDGRGQTAYFNQTALIFTSNIGASDLPAEAGWPGREGIMGKLLRAGGTLSYDDLCQHFREEVRWYFTQKIGRAEIYNRLGDNIVVFDMLRAEHIRGIGRKFIKALAASAEEKHDLCLNFDETVDQWLASAMTEGDNMLFGGRRIKALIESRVERPLNRWAFLNRPARGSRCSVSMTADSCCHVAPEGGS